MELRVLHAAARRMTWYGQWHYGFGRGGFNMRPQQVGGRTCCTGGAAGAGLGGTWRRVLHTRLLHVFLPWPPLHASCPCCLPSTLPSPSQWHDAIEYVHGATVADVLADFDGIDATVLDILQRYRVRCGFFFLFQHWACIAAGCWALLGVLCSVLLGAGRAVLCCRSAGPGLHGVTTCQPAAAPGQHAPPAPADPPLLAPACPVPSCRTPRRRRRMAGGRRWARC